VQDHRSLAEMKRVAATLGFDPVCKDWDCAYHPSDCGNEPACT